MDSFDKYDFFIFDCDGVILDSNDLKTYAFKKVLKKICPGIFGSIKPVGYCMIGQR